MLWPAIPQLYLHPTRLPDWRPMLPAKPNAHPSATPIDLRGQVVL